MAIHVAHPSVRMKGAEAEWTPIECTDRECSQSLKGPHLHCPFCSLDSPFTDQALLKAHYRVKHVDKGIDFGGLKILRGCRSCIVHGIIQEQKYFKGAHWHCYHCRNGFSRRDEATKHYQQHFRHPETTIQIVITRDVNQIFTTYTNPAATSESMVTHLIVPQSQQPSETDMLAPGYEPVDGQQPQIEYQYTCVNDQSQGTANGEVVLIEIADDGSKGELADEACYTEHNLSLLLQEKERLERTLEEERAARAKAEHRMKGTIERLRTKVEYLSNTNTSLKQQLSMMHTSSLKRLTDDGESQSLLNELLQHMSEEHNQLLRHHLAQLRLYAQACQIARPVPGEPTSSGSTVLVPDLASQSQDMPHVAVVPSSSRDALGNMEQTVVMTITSEDSSESLGNTADNPEDPLQHGPLTLDKDVVHMSADGMPYPLTNKGLYPRGGSSEAGDVYPAEGPHPQHSRGCEVIQQDFCKDKTLRLVLSNNAPKLFCPDAFDKRTLDDDMSSEGPPLKRGRNNSQST